MYDRLGDPRSALHNCVAHQDYRLGGKINVVEHPDRLVFSRTWASSSRPSVEWMLEHQSPPEHCTATSG
jgi:ATP-dependent DNA helicase RecG